MRLHVTGLVAFLLVNCLVPTANNLLTASINIAKGKPAAQISTDGKSTAGLAVDGYADTCAKTEPVSENPWWRVDLEHRVWVNELFLDTKTALSEVEIRIGDDSDANHATNKLCRQGPRVLSEPLVYQCVEPVLGRYVYARLLGKQALILCEVQVYVSHDLTVNYLAAVDKTRVIQKGYFALYVDPNHFYLNISKRDYSLKVHVKDIIVNEAPMREMLQLNEEVIIPVKYKKLKDGNVTATCGTWESKKEKSLAYVSGTIIREADDKYVVKADYVPHEGENKKRKVEEFTCSLNTLRLRVNDICKLDASRRCPNSSSCNTTFFVAAFPPASFYCKCAYGHPTPLFLPHKSCEKEKKIELKPFIRHSKQNLAMGMETEASSIETPALSRFAVDGSSDSCFLLLTEQRPWFIVHLDRHHPIALIHVVLKKAHKTEETMTVYVVNHGRHVRCATVKTALIAWSTDCETTKTEPYIWGNAVRIQKDSKTLHLCEVQVYAETYGNIVLKHPLSDEKLLKTIDGIMTSCLSETKKIEWRIDFGSKLRVAVVFIRLSHLFTSLKENAKIEAGFGDSKTECMQTSLTLYMERGIYAACEGVQVATYVAVQIPEKKTHSLCEVEIFQTKTINVAARRPMLDRSGKIYSGDRKPELCNDQRIDKVYSLHQNGDWAVDLLTPVDLSLIRIITDREYEMSVIEGLSISRGRLPPGSKVSLGPFTVVGATAEEVFDLTYNTKGNISTITFKSKTEARWLVVHSSEKDLGILELEVYSGFPSDVDEDECLKADACPPNFKCRNWPKKFSCECPTEGFRSVEEANGKTKIKQCLDIDECKEKNLCPVTHSHCKNILGSYLCLCNKGYDAIYDSDNRLQECKELDECKHPLLFNGCPKLSHCKNLPGGYTCACEPGYESTEPPYNDNDKDIECVDKSIRCKKEKPDCDYPRAKCTIKNADGNESFSCHCKAGYTGKSTNCTDFDECSTDGRKRCQKDAECINNPGSYECRCKNGFRGDGIICSDVDECANKKNCPANATCNNVEGSFECRCKNGFDGKDPFKNCTDVDECQTLPGACGYTGQMCVNSLGSFDCKCSPGFYQLGYESGEDFCEDINECETSEKPCGSYNYRKCVNMDGDYTCHCEYGFHFNKEKQACEDIDECVTRDFACADQANCVNNEGDFECVCPEGYEGNGKDYCSANTSASIKKEINWTVFVTMATTSLIIILLKSNEF